MARYRHRRGKILFEVFGTFLLASATAAWGAGYALRLLIVAALIALYGLYRAVMLFSRNPALAYDQKGVQVGRLFKISAYKWGQIRDIREVHWQRPSINSSIPYMRWYLSWVYCYIYFLPQERDYIELLIQDAGLGSGSFRIRADMIELPPGGVKEIIQGFRGAQVAALGDRGAALARLGASEADKARAPASGVQAERWQRLGIGAESDGDAAASAEGPTETLAAAAPQAYVPPRPVFGRKTS
jgi:hypothetical protein